MNIIKTMGTMNNLGNTESAGLRDMFTKPKSQSHKYEYPNMDSEELRRLSMENARMVLGYRPLTDLQRIGIHKMIKWLDTEFDGQYYVSGYSIYHSILKMEGLLKMGTYSPDDQQFLNKMRILYKDLKDGNKG